MQQAVIVPADSQSWQPKEAAPIEAEPGYVEIPVPADKRENRTSQPALSPAVGGTQSEPGQCGGQRERNCGTDTPTSATQSHQLSDHGGERTDSNPPSPFTESNDEAHYITTHEIQLCEADQEPDYPDFGLVQSTWTEPSDSAPCGFLEYASFDSQGGSPTTDEDCSYYMSTTSDPNPTDSVISTYSESDTSPSICGTSTRDRAANTEEARSKAGILLSIQTASKAIKEPSNEQAEPNTAPTGPQYDTDMSLVRATDTRSALWQHRSDPRLVAVPARLQVRTDISSGASSAVSELDDADKEVRSLTSRAFRSLAYPYFEAINFSSSESTTSLSDQNINSWSTFLDFKGGALLSQKAERTATTTTASSFGLRKFAQKDAQKEQVILQTNKSQTKAFELVVSGLAKNGATGGNATCSAQRFQSGSRVVTLTETLNLSSNVTSTGSDRANKAPEPPADGVTDPLPRELAGHEASKPTHIAAEAMEGTHKSKFASSLLKNVISKKMQLEQEFKMERGEITDTSFHVLTAPTRDTEGAKDKGLQRQSSRFSEASSSDLTLVSGEDLGDFVDAKSSVTPKDFAPAEGIVAKQVSSIEHHREESVTESKKGATDTMKGMFLRSHNSAFRSWKEKEIEKMERKIEEKVAKARKIKIPLERDWRADVGELPGNKSTKMSRLYVPSIQHTPKEKPLEKHATKYSLSTYAHESCFSRNERGFKTEKLQVMESVGPRMTPMLTPKPQEIRLNLPLSSDKENPFNIAKLLTPNLASTVANLSRAAEEHKTQVPHCRAEVLEKMPQFMVRDVREPKSKVQGPIHQVRDVRKLLKSSYHHDTGEGSDKGSGMSGHSTPDPKAKLCVASKVSSALSPIVITCQAVKNKDEGSGDKEGSVEDEKSLSSADTILVHRASGRLPVATIAPNKTGPRMPVVKIVSKASKWNQEKPKEPEVKAEPQTPPTPPTPPVTQTPQTPQSRAALEKLTAAVKTMEQLYVFDKREWKRKDQPDKLTGSHVLSLISCEEAECKQVAQAPIEKSKSAEDIKTPTTPSQPPRSSEPLMRRNSYPSQEKDQAKHPDNKGPPKTFRVSRFGDAKNQEQQGKSPSVVGNNRSLFTVNKQQSTDPVPSNRKVRPQPPGSLKIQPRNSEETKRSEPERAAANSQSQPPQGRKASTDCENYLTIPVKGPGEAAGVKPPVAAAIRDSSATSAVLCSLPPFTTKGQVTSPKSPVKASGHWRSKVKEGVQPNRASSAGSEPQTPDSIPSATIYHQPFPQMQVTMPTAQGPIFYSPPIPTATPTEMYPPQTQRKMLVDLATGQYYLVDTPVQPVKRRLFDPETGQYVEVPVPPPPATPIPLSMPPMALSPGSYAPYMFYPGFMSAATPTMLPATLQSQLSHQSTEHNFEMTGVEKAQSGEMNMTECPYYLATGSAVVNPATGQTADIRRGSLGCPESKQVISILSQPGPRIVAPPSFDGTTMRFVVEHR
ncbi:hypothetical protein GDO86_000706 [Hymenochirus boettgeri]|uniref:DUF4585 domain-containing protein n=1 Tax=Hymenochirus boettgeri TaxID=247094 RepID=A0A8T2K9K4_9PIPI|nr:hypothetical protein GDO86_000706 [Hymenochirus boettgeri]